MFFIKKEEAYFYDKKQIARWKFKKYRNSTLWQIYIDFEYIYYYCLQ